MSADPFVVLVVVGSTGYAVAVEDRHERCRIINGGAFIGEPIRFADCMSRERAIVAAFTMALRLAETAEDIETAEASNVGR